MQKKDSYDLIVIGAGPAGLFAAVRAASEGLKVCVLEKNRQAGKKLLITGAGQCNLTHGGSIREFPDHYGSAGRFVRPALLNFTNLQLMDFFGERGLEMRDRGDGKIFPVTERSRDVLEVLLRECRRHEVTIRYSSPAGQIRRVDEGFLVTSGKTVYSGSCLLLAAGGMSYPSTGSSGDGYELARKLGHSITAPYPVLAPVIIRNYRFSRCAGISLAVSLSVWREGKKRGEYGGDLLFTHQGLSGPVILNNSRDIRSGDELRVSFRGVPEAERSDFRRQMLDDAAAGGKRTLKRYLSAGKLPERLILLLLQECGIPAETTLSQLNKKSRETLLESLFSCSFPVTRTGGFNVAMATGGGIPLKEVKAGSLASKLVDRLYFAGEVLDVDGDTGGYNLQFAFSSGRLAAENIIGNLKD